MKDRVGRVQRQVRRAFIVADGKPLCIADLLPRCYPRARQYTVWQRWCVHRALRKYGQRIGRSKTGRGCPIVWLPSDYRTEGTKT